MAHERAIRIVGGDQALERGREDEMKHTKKELEQENLELRKRVELLELTVRALASVPAANLPMPCPYPHVQLNPMPFVPQWPSWPYNDTITIAGPIGPAFPSVPSVSTCFVPVQ